MSDGTDWVDDLFSELEAERHLYSNDPPPVAPVVEATLRMSTAYPFERARAAWPPFTGLRVALGGDRS